MLLTGSTGCGKTWLACAFGNKTCRNGRTMLFQRLPLLLEGVHVSHADATVRRRLAQLNTIDLLILDFGISTMTPQSRADLLEVVDSRAGSRSTLVTSRIPMR